MEITAADVRVIKTNVSQEVRPWYSERSHHILGWWREGGRKKIENDDEFVLHFIEHDLTHVDQELKIKYTTL